MSAGKLAVSKLHHPWPKATNRPRLDEPNADFERLTT